MAGKDPHTSRAHPLRICLDGNNRGVDSKACFDLDFR